MADYDLIIRDGTVVTASDQFHADIGIRAGRIAALAERLDGGPILDAGGLLVLEPRHTGLLSSDRMGALLRVRPAGGGGTLAVLLTSPPVVPTGRATRNHIADVSDRGTEAGTGRVLRSHVTD